MANDTLTCPKCGPVPIAECFGIEIRGGYDGISEWQHLACGTIWNRWTGEVVSEVGEEVENADTVAS